MRESEQLIEEGGAALADGDWVSAQSLFEQAIALEETPEAHAGLGEAVWWQGDLERAISQRQKAYVGFRATSDYESAFEMGLLLVFDFQGHVGNYVASSGWISRLQRLVADNDLDELEGWLQLAKANENIDPAVGEEMSRAALAFAKETGDIDLELCALSLIGSCLVAQGATDEGIALLDEALAGSLGGESESRDIVVLTSCKMMVSCVGIGDFDRATKWAYAADRFVTQYGCPFLYAECRTIYGSVLVSTGDWEAAEQELLTAIETSVDSIPVFAAQARATLAQLRLCQGRQSEARKLVSGIEDHSWAVPVVARLHLDAGRNEAAASVLERRLRGEDVGIVERSLLEELLGEAEIGLGSADKAMGRAERLRETAGEGDARVVTARTERLNAKALAATADNHDAVTHFERALEAFSSLDMSYQVALTREAMAVAMIVENREGALAELESAMGEFDRMGADHDADRTAARLRSFGVDVRFRGGRRSDGSLTKREREVLGLVATGLSNPEIGERLFISRKTVEHHVASILTKLGVRNRVEAAEAARELGVE